MGNHRSVLAEFEKDLVRAKDLLDLISSFKDFAASTVPGQIVEDTIHWKEALNLSNIAPRVRTDLPILAGSLVMYLCGRFEYFARDLVIAVVDELSSRASSFDEFPEKLKKQIRESSLMVAQNPERHNFTDSDVKQILINLADMLAQKPGISFVRSDVLTITDTNMNGRTLAEIFRRVGVEDLWKNIGKQAQLKIFLSQAEDGTCTAEAQHQLDRYMTIRNGLAHPTAATVFPDSEQVRDMCEFFDVLGKVLVDVVLVPRK
jgi:hypothetical protein